MIYLGRRIVFAIIVGSLVIQPGKAIKDSSADVLPREIAQVTNEEVPGTSGINMKHTLAALREMEAVKEVTENKESEHKKILVEADKAIADAEALINQYGRMELQETEIISGQALKKNIIVAERGGRTGYKFFARVPQYDLSNEEFNLMARVVQAEAGGEPYEGQVAVANVIFNRVKAGWAGTVTEVINQRGQFTQIRKEPSASVKEAVKEALYGRNAVPEGTLFFQNLAISTDFTIPNSKKYVTKIGMHTFYR